MQLTTSRRYIRLCIDLGAELTWAGQVAETGGGGGGASYRTMVAAAWVALGRREPYMRYAYDGLFRLLQAHRRHPYEASLPQIVICRLVCGESILGELATVYMKRDYGCRESGPRSRAYGGKTR